MKKDEFFSKQNCDRCGNTLTIRTMSWFTDECICSVCSSKESALKQKLEKNGIDTAELEGCGFVPKEDGSK